MISSTDFDDETGAIVKAKFKMHWVQWKTREGTGGSEIREAKQKKTSIKLKFDEFGQFSEYCD